jgi:CheY-like chemotaxis protein
MRKLEAAGQLAGGLAHDFNNLLTVIVASLEFVRERLPRGDRGHDDLDAAAGAADRAARLTRQLLTFARRQPVEPRVTNLTDTVASLERILAALLSERVTRRASLAHDLWNVLVDPAQLEQVIMNLVLNSRDAMPSGGVVTIETRNVGRADGDFVLLAVEDTGVGMDRETQQRIFEPFFTTKAEGEGTGLGLATVYGIVRQAGGQIEVRSAPGKGARFEVLLPRCDRVADAVGQVPHWAPRGNEQILLVENEAGVRAAVARALTTQGYSVLEADGGEAALELPLDEVALAIVDVVMPGMDGWQLGRELRKRRPGQRLLFISGFVPSPEHALERSAFLAKPFTPDQLVRRVRDVLDAA